MIMHGYSTIDLGVTGRAKVIMLEYFLSQCMELFQHNSSIL